MSFAAREMEGERVTFKVDIQICLNGAPPSKGAIPLEWVIEQCKSPVSCGCGNRFSHVANREGHGARQFFETKDCGCFIAMDELYELIEGAAR